MKLVMIIFIMFILKILDMILTAEEVGSGLKNRKRLTCLESP